MTLTMNSSDSNIFLKVAKTLSFKEASSQLKMSRSSVSKRVAQLEKELGAALVNRTPRSVSLTEAGKVFRTHCEEIQEVIVRAERSIKDYDLKPVGILRTSMPSALGAQLMPELMTVFEAKYPSIRLVTHFGELFVPVVKGGYDVVILVAEKLTDSSLKSTRLATSPRLLVASPEYLRQHGTPGHVRDLASHRCIGLGFTNNEEPNDQWHFLEPGANGIDVRVGYHYVANNDLALILAACLGVGILYTTEILVKNELERGRLVPVLPEFCEPVKMGVFAVYPQKQPSAKVRAFIDFIKERLASLETADRWSPLKGPARP